LPGFPAGVEMQVFGGDRPVFLQALFMDRGSPEFDIAFQQFAAAPVRVDWKGWKVCRFPAPPLPPLYAAERGNPFYSPRYPLNLVLTAWTEDGRSAVIRVDQIKVSTHLPKKDELVVELEYPDETMLHLPGAPLKVLLANLSSEPMALDARYRLTTPVGLTAGEGVCKTTLAPGARLAFTLVEKLSEGFYQLRMDGLPEGRTFDADVQAPNRARYFGDALMARLSDIKGLNADLGLTEKRINLDWDTAEPVPDLHHHEWFRRYAAAESDDGTYEVVPIVGYAADWAGPEKQAAVEDGTYTRDVGSYMQVPVRMADWDAFMRTVGREHAKDSKKWVFWQSPDMQESNPIYLPPERYRLMFDIFHRWISLYNPDACVIAGGFRFDRVLGYLNGMPEPHTLPFDLFEVRVNPGSVSVEEVQLEDFLEELGAKLKLAETGRKVSVVELDWVTDDQFGLLPQAAYHVRAAILLHAAGALPHQFSSANKFGTKDGFGLLFHPTYGNSSIQNQRVFYVPKPAYFGLIEARKMLADLEYLKRVHLADRDPLANRAYLFKSKNGGICAVIWRVTGAQAYQLPAEWKSAAAVDAFGMPVALDESLPVGPLPLFLRFADLPVDRVAHGLRNLQPLDGDDSHDLILDVLVADAASVEATEYKATGGDRIVRHPGRVYGGEGVFEGFRENVTEERFAFTLDKAGDVLMSRLWYLDAAGDTNRTMRVVLNGGSAQTNNLAPALGLASTNNVDKVYVSGPRRSAFVLRGCRAGRNEVVLHHNAPTPSGGFRLTRIRDGRVDLTSCGPLACLDSGVPVQAFRNAAGVAMSMGKKSYASGLGCMGQTALEYPLNKQFSKFEVTVGIDTMAKGRGSVVFRILVDGVERKTSGTMTGMTIPKTLMVEELDEAERLLLWVDEAGDGPDNDLANWADPILHVKETK
ncbi:MAG: hypothetical protein FJ224_07835, partial [Lentisphaerae bacterium]|nr:hypothetical protein [Lentisphaerota bacterium]